MTRESLEEISKKSNSIINNFNRTDDTFFVTKKKKKLIHSFNSSCGGENSEMHEIAEDESLSLDDIELIESVTRYEAQEIKKTNQKIPKKVEKHYSYKSSFF